MSEIARLNSARWMGALTLWLTVSAVFSHLACAGPTSITVQGKLTDAAGVPLGGARSYRVQFHDSETAGHPLGAPIGGTVDVSPSGRFSIEVAPPEEALAAGVLYYELAIDSAATPDNAIDAADVFPNRVRVTSVMFAQKLARDGEGTGLNADLLDGRHAAEFATTAGLAAGLAGKADTAHPHDLQALGGAVTDAQVPDDITVHFADAAATATRAETARDAERLAGLPASDFATTDGLNSGLAGKADLAHMHDLQNLGGAITDAQVPDDITIRFATAAGSATTATFAAAATTASFAGSATTATFAETARDAGRLAGLVASDFATTSNLINGLASKAGITHLHNLQSLGGAVTDAQVPDDITIIEQDTLQTVTNRGGVTTQGIRIANASDATSTQTGALVVAGGAGLGGNLHVGGDLYYQGRRLMARRLVSSDTQAESDCDYLTPDTTATIVITLPPAPAAGDTVRISAMGTGGWRIAQSGAQQIVIQAMGIPSYSSARAKDSARNWKGIAASHDGTRWAACSDGAIVLSSDSGVTWTTASLAASCQAIASCAEGSRLAVCGNGFVYTSDDSGSTWTDKTPTPLVPSKNWSEIGVSADGKYLAVCEKVGSIRMSSDFGGSWTPRMAATNWSGIAASADGARWVACVDGGSIFRSANYGATWTPIAIMKNWKSIATSADGRIIAAVASNEYINLSYDHGATWNVKESIRAWTSIAMTSDGSKIVAGFSSDASTICFSTDGGAHWKQAWGINNVTCIALSANGAQMVAGYGSANLYRYMSLPTPLRTTAGPGGYLSGGQHSIVEMRYLGNEVFAPISFAGPLGAR